MMKICLDPGHSGPVEPGACNAGLTEASLNLTISQKLGNLLINKNYDVIYTREGDIEDTSLSFRANIANKANADLFISVHCNAAENEAAHGIETYCRTGAAAGRKLAEKVQENLAALEYTLDRGVKEANFAVLRLTDMPSILIECGFITSEYDREYLTSVACQDNIALAIVMGIEDYLS
jgi:N-acetylmuramoyl-L-alanine amidase